MAEVPLGRAQLVGKVRLIPHMSDAYFELVGTLLSVHEEKRDYPGAVAMPACIAIMSVATIESYVNELAELLGDQRQREISDLGTDVVGKLGRLKATATKPQAMTDETLEDFRNLVGLRGLLVHYDPKGEHPAQTRTSLQRLAERLGTPVPHGDTEYLSLEMLLTPEMGRGCYDLVVRVIRELFGAGYALPRPRWQSVTGALNPAV